MNITPKSPEHMQAQVADYAQYLHMHEKNYVFQHLGEIAAGPVEDIEGKVSGGSWQNNIEVPFLLPKEDYLDYLRHYRRPIDREEVAMRAEFISGYDTFAPDIESLQANLPDKHSESPHYLGRGIAAEAYVFEHNGREYVARIPLPERSHAPAYRVEQHLSAAVRNHSIPHLEHIVAASYESAVTVAEKMPGKSMRDLSLDEIAAIPTDQFSTLLETVMAADKDGIEIDPTGFNCLYDPKEGFGIIDLMRANRQFGEMPTIINLMTAFKINHIERDGPREDPHTAFDYQQSTAQLQRMSEAVGTISTLTSEQIDYIRSQIDLEIDKNTMWLRDHHEDISGKKPHRLKGILRSLIRLS